MTLSRFDSHPVTQSLAKVGLRLGRAIAGSKTSYRRSHPGHIVVFNANVFTERDGKVFYGDLDLTLDGEALTQAALANHQTLYVLREIDGRFEHEERPFSEVLVLAIRSYPHHHIKQPKSEGA